MKAFLTEVLVKRDRERRKDILIDNQIGRQTPEDFLSFLATNSCQNNLDKEWGKIIVVTVTDYYAKMS